jgi:AcrR family transcriptional regulator
MTDTRERILVATGELYTRQGYPGTGLKQIVERAQAPFGSIYHFFPGGKRELTAAVIRHSGAIYGELVPMVFDPAADAVAGVRDFFAGAAAHLEATDFADACPVATIALEVASTDDELRAATAEVFDSWLALLRERIHAAGVPAPRALELAQVMLCALEGGFMLCRAQRTIGPLLVNGDAMAGLLAAEIGAASA